MSFGLASGIPRRRIGFVLLTTLAVFSVSSLAVSPPASAQVTPFFAVTGPISVSVDSGGSTAGAHFIQVERPSDSAVVLVAFLFAAGSPGRIIADGDVILNDTPVAWAGGVFHTVPAARQYAPLFFNNVLADVTPIVAPVVDAAPPGRISFDVAEVGSATIDGEILVVVFEDPSQAEQRTLWLAFGGSSFFLDQYVLTLLDPIDPAQPSAVADFGLGIANALQSDFDSLPSSRFVDVEDTRLTSAAGGEDDGSGSGGALITAGGLDDSNANPTDPDAPPDGNPFADDELYSLLPFLSSTDTRLRVTTTGASSTDNYFFSYFVLSEFAVVNQGVLLRPEFEQNEEGTEHTVLATVVDDRGTPLPGVTVFFEVTTGPNAGTTGSSLTDGAGVAGFTYTGAGGAGFDEIVARFFDGQQNQVFSNVVTKQWVTSLEVLLATDTPTSLVGTEVTVVAGVTDAQAEPRAGLEVSFHICGPNADVEGQATTDDNGNAFFTYAGLSTGIDEVTASVVDDLGVTQSSNTVEIEWVTPSFDPQPDLAASGDGTVLVVRESGIAFTDILMDLLDGGGEVLSSGIVTDGSELYRSPAVAYLDDGTFMVVFVRVRPQTNALIGLAVGADGQPLGAPFVIDDAGEACSVDPVSACPIARPAVAALGGGGFAAAWQRDGSVAGRVFATDGAAGEVFQVAGPGSGSPAVAGFADGSFAVAYGRHDGVAKGVAPGDFDTIRLARFDAAGELVDDVLANLFTGGGLQAEPTVAAGLAGSPVVAWESFGEAAGAGIFGRVDPADPEQPEIQVNTQIDGDQLYPDLAIEPTGLVAAVWLNEPGNVIAGQRFTLDLFLVDGEFVAQPSTLLGTEGDAPVLGRTRLASMSDGSLAVVAGVAPGDADPDGGAAVAFVEPTPLETCIRDGLLVCIKERLAVRKAIRRTASRDR